MILEMGFVSSNSTWLEAEGSYSNGTPVCGRKFWQTVAVTSLYVFRWKQRENHINVVKAASRPAYLLVDRVLTTAQPLDQAIANTLPNIQNLAKLFWE